MLWQFNDIQPVYLQIMGRIQSAVLSGEFAPGDKLPSVRNLAMEARVNPNTMQHALQELERNGLLITQGTSGKYVTENMQVIEALRASQVSQLVAYCAEQFAALGISPDQAGRYLMEYAEERNE